MDRQSIKVLRYIQKSRDCVSRSALISIFGDDTGDIIRHLKAKGYIREGEQFGGVYRNPATGRAETRNSPNGMYSIEPVGDDFLEQLPGKTFDKWVTRISAIIGLITGVLSLILHFAD